jgi:hypothetical protein
VRPVELVAKAKEQLGELTGLDIEGATGIDRNGEGWIVTLVVLELERTPNTMDVLGAYEVVVGDDGELETFKRVRRFHRSATEED